MPDSRSCTMIVYIVHNKIISSHAIKNQFILLCWKVVIQSFDWFSLKIVQTGWRWWYLHIKSDSLSVHLWFGSWSFWTSFAFRLRFHSHDRWTLCARWVMTRLRNVCNVSTNMHLPIFCCDFCFQLSDLLFYAFLLLQFRLSKYIYSSLWILHISKVSLCFDWK